ncbi:MAG TPA: hypothetical protein DG414_00065 [Gammaproteobacteria bacterium]|jgi:hypothetical protein|nr:DciA family protein [Arenicellales bacterium]HCY12205.1 hypothetical protein [Gammaproteobacteria bacterium]|tara:strand:- start:6437 stop:6889 length:453 start_codon:yes stop_codon:yes gene_type:complete
MGDSSFTHLGQLIGNLPGLPAESDRAKAVAQQQAWRKVAGDEIAAHTEVQVENRNWRIVADAPVWGHAVSQRRQALLEGLTQAGLQPVDLMVEVRPPRTPVSTPAPVRQQNPLDPGSAELLRQTAHGLKSRDLAESLNRLSRHTGKNRSS